MAQISSLAASATGTAALFIAAARTDAPSWFLLSAFAIAPYGAALAEGGAGTLAVAAVRGGKWASLRRDGWRRAVLATALGPISLAAFASSGTAVAAASAVVTVITALSIAMYQLGLAVRQGRYFAGGTVRPVAANAGCLFASAAATLLLDLDWPLIALLYALSYTIPILGSLVMLRAADATPSASLHRLPWAIPFVLSNLVPVVGVAAFFGDLAQVYAIADRPTAAFGLLGTLAARYASDGGGRLLRRTPPESMLVGGLAAIVGGGVGCAIAACVAALSEAPIDGELLVLSAILGSAHAFGLAFSSDEVLMVLRRGAPVVATCARWMLGITAVAVVFGCLVDVLPLLAVGVLCGRVGYVARLLPAAHAIPDRRRTLTELAHGPSTS